MVQWIKEPAFFAAVEDELWSTVRTAARLGYHAYFSQCSEVFAREWVALSGEEML